MGHDVQALGRLLREGDFARLGIEKGREPGPRLFQPRTLERLAALIEREVGREVVSDQIHQALLLERAKPSRRIRQRHNS